MSQTLIALALVVVAGGWVAWTYLPGRLRKKVSGGKCGKPNCSCGD